MILTVTPNPAWDITVRAERVTPGAGHRVPAGTARAGGKGVNVSRVLAQQGYDNLSVLPLGGPTGDVIAADLDSAGLVYSASPITGESRRTVALVDESTGDTSIFNEPGPELRADDVGRLLSSAGHAAAGAGVLTGNGSLPPGCPPGFYADLVQIAHNHGAACIIDTSGPGLLAAAEAGADLLMPNADEAMAAAEKDDPIAAARILLSRGALRVLVSAGADGMYDVRPGEPVRHASIGRVLSGNPTGAGDAAVAAAAAAMSQVGAHADAQAGGNDLLAAATGWSAAAVTMPAAGELSATVTELVAEIRIETDSSRTRKG